MLLTDGPLEEQAKYLLPDALGLEPSDETTLLAAENSDSLAPTGKASFANATVPWILRFPPVRLFRSTLRSAPSCRAETGCMSFSGPSIS
jgi:hypothetical protein